MAIESAMQQGFWIDGRDVSGDIGAFNNIGSPRAMQDTPNIDKTAMQRLMLRGDGIIDYAGYFDDATDKLFDATEGMGAADQIGLIAFGGPDVGDVCAMLIGKQTDNQFTKDPDGGVTVASQLIGTGTPLEWGLMLTALSDTFSSSGSGSGRNDGASSPAGAAVVLQVIDITSGTPTVVIEDSANGSSWATLVTMSAVANGAEPTAERKTVSGTVDQHLRITTTGTFSNLVLAVGIRRGESVDDLAYT